VIRHWQLWRIWTRGWGVRDWWAYFRRDGLPISVAWVLPRAVVYWCYVRVTVATAPDPSVLTFGDVCKVWREKGTGK
jgi:hypothetical protein